MFRKQYPFPNSETARYQYGGVKAVSLCARQSCPRPGSGVYKPGARDSVYNPHICLSPLPLSSLALMFWERKREIEDSGRWKLGEFSASVQSSNHNFFSKLEVLELFSQLVCCGRGQWKAVKEEPQWGFVCMAEQQVVLEGSQPVDLAKHPSGIVPTLQSVSLAFLSIPACERIGSFELGFRWSKKKGRVVWRGETGGACSNLVCGWYIHYFLLLLYD
jgi:hypothetical protein